MNFNLYGALDAPRIVKSRKKAGQACLPLKGNDRMRTYLVEARYSLIRTVAMQILAPDEIGAQAEIERLMGRECDASTSWFEREAGTGAKFVENAGEMVPELIGVSAAAVG
jgi:hypothetical protein